jgi:formylglycine-generating enzyme required for sulfatase activity
MICVPGGTTSCNGQATAVQSFCLGALEVSAGDYEACVLGRNCPTPPADAWVRAHPQSYLDMSSRACTYRKLDRLTHPMNCVRWADATAYCEQQGWRLPTDAEWILAAGGPEGRKYPWGEAPPDGRVLNACDQTCAAVLKTKEALSFTDGWANTSPVGSKSAVGLGFFDLAGNVQEWTAGRCARGGAWHTSDARYFQSCAPRGTVVCAKEADNVEARDSSIGFRCAADAK